MNRDIGILIAQPSRHLLPVLVPVSTLCACSTNRPPDAVDAHAVVAGVSESPGSAPRDKAEVIPAKYYVRVGRNGQTMYCQTLQLTGSRLPSESCRTQAELDEKTQKAQNFLNESQRAAMQQTPPSAH